MKEKVIEGAQYQSSNTLESEVWQLFLESASTRFHSGVNTRLRHGYIRDKGADLLLETDMGDYELPSEECGCDCKEDETCDLCNKQFDNVCVKDAVTKYKDYSPFDGIANLLATVKKYEYISLVENVYSPVGNRPFKLKARKEASPDDSEIDSSANDFYDFLEVFLEENQVRITELPEALNLDTLGQVSDELSNIVQQDADIRLKSSLKQNEDVLERVFKRANFMEQYIEVLKDTTDYPIGVMWVDDETIKKQRIIKRGKLVNDIQIQADAKRIDPCYFWATDDHELNYTGRAYFHLRQFRKGEIEMLIDEKVSGSAKVNTSIKEYLEDNPNSHAIATASLFHNSFTLRKGLYDVLISRGWYSRESVKEYNVPIPDEYKKEDYIPTEVWYSGGKVLKVKVIEGADETLGVYTTVFRRRGQNLFGYSLHDFVSPFTKMYEGTIKNIDEAVGKSTGAIIAFDTGVIDDPEKYFKVDADGTISLDLSKNLLIEFDSGRSTSPNFKGLPFQIEQLPSDLQKLLPVINLIFEQLERLTGIPTILTNTNDIPSALRTNRNFTMAFQASSKTVRALLRESERRILKPSIRYFFNTQANEEGIKDFLLEADPEILLSDKLVREENDDRQLVQDVIELSQFSQLIPPEKIGALINNLGREVYNLDEDLVPGLNPLSTSQPSQAVGEVA